MNLTAEHKRKIYEAGAKGEHVCTPESCPPGNYYVSAVDGPSWWIMAGPYDSHAAALADTNKARNIAYEHEGKAWFMAWGTCQIDNHREPGNLNKLGLMEAI